MTREASAAMRAMVRRFADAVVEATAEVDPTAPCPPARRRDALLATPAWIAWGEAMVRRIWPAPSQSVAALVDDFHDAVKCRSGVDESKAALLAAIAAQEAVSEAAQAEVVRLRQIAVDARNRIAELTAEATTDPRRDPTLAVTWLTWVATQIEGAALKEPT